MTVMAAADDRSGLSARNRRVLRVLLGIVALLVASAFAIGIRW
jgi:hypothetical protein